MQSRRGYLSGQGPRTLRSRLTTDAGAVAVSQTLRATLYETSPLDVNVFAGAFLVLIAAFAAASTIPVRRALQVNPVDVLRNE